MFGAQYEWTVWIVIISAILVGMDAKNLGVKAGMLGGGLTDMGPFSWFLVVALLWIIGFPAYLITRPRYLALKASPAAPALTIPPGWKPDVTGRHESRYWDGQKWSDAVADAGVQSVDPIAPSA